MHVWRCLIPTTYMCLIFKRIHVSTLSLESLMNMKGWFGPRSKPLRERRVLPAIACCLFLLGKN